jgi:hypothetical protein
MDTDLKSSQLSVKWNLLLKRSGFRALQWHLIVSRWHCDVKNHICFSRESEEGLSIKFCCLHLEYYNVSPEAAIHGEGMRV